MTRQRFNPTDDTFETWPRVDTDAVTEAVHNDVGAEFPIDWQNGYPIVDDADIPDGVKMGDLKAALKTHHPR